MMKIRSCLAVLLVMAILCTGALAEVQSSMKYNPMKGTIIIECSGLYPNTEYGFFLTQTDDGEIPALGDGNLLRVDQIRSSSNGTLHVAIIDKTLPECAVLLGGKFEGTESPFVAGRYDPEETMETQDDTIRLPAALTRIEDEAFEGCVFNYVYIEDKLEEIGSRAFADCRHLFAVYIPDSVHLIADDAFDGSEKVTIISSESAYARSYAVDKGINWQIQ